MLRRLSALVCRSWYALPLVILAGCISPLTLIPSSPNPPPVDYASAPSAPTPCAQANGAPADLLSTPGYLQFQAYDLDASGSPVTGLTQSDFAVRDGSTAFPIAYFHENASDTPASILIVIDASEGMFTKINARSGDSAARVHKALAKSIESFGRCDEIAIVVSGGKYASGFRPKDFGFPAALSDVTLQTGFTSDHSVTLTALDNLVASGPGNLSDAMQLGMRQFIGAYYPARVMVIVTDGLDTRALDGSQRYFLNAKLYGVTTKVIAIGHEQTSASSFPSSLQRTEALDLNAVRDFASATQAEVMLAQPVNDDDGASLAKALTTIGTQIGRSYSIGVIGPHATRPILSRTGSSTDLLSANLVPTSIVAKQASPPSTNSPAQCAAHAPPPPSITSRPGYTQLRVSVADSDGHRVPGLKQSDFLVTCDLNPLSVVYSHEDIAGIPTSVLVAVDVSTSMTEKMEGAYPEIADVIRGLNSCDDVGLLAFSDDPILVQPLSTDHYLTAGRVASLKAYGRTGLYDAINDSAEIVAKGKYPNRAIILVTDGVDNVSRASMSDVLKTLADRNVQVNVIGIGNASTALQFSLLPLGISFPGSANQKVIKGLAARTGGVDYIATSGNVENRKQLALAASHVKAALGFGYDLGFTSPSGKLDDLKISIAHHPEYAVEIVTVPTAASLIRLHPSKN